MAKSGKPPSQILATKKDSLDWGRFNFLENLLVFCANKTWDVKPEGGVCFRVNVPSDQNCLCLIFEIDRKGSEKLVRETDYDKKRPDYLVVYVNNGRCIFTIIEMKRRSETNDGVEQILTFYRLLQRELKEHLPTKFKPEFQGILLTQHLSQEAQRKIEKSWSNGFRLMLFISDRTADIFPFISDTISKPVETDRPKRNSAPSRDFTWLEEILIQKALPRRLEDIFQAIHCPNPNQPLDEGVFLNYLISTKDDYAALFANRRRCVIGINGSANCSKKIIASLEAIGVAVGRTISIESIT